jgi:hypothetical protein
MNDSRPFFVTHELREGFLAPLDSLKFFRRHKILLVSALAPQVAFLAGMLWAAFTRVLPWAEARLASGLATSGTLGEMAASVPDGLLAGALAIALFIACVVLYTLLGVPFLNVVLSPLFDIMAARAYEETSGRKLPNLGWSDFFRSFLSECSKLIIIYTTIILAFFVPLLVPAGFVLSFLLGPLFLVASIWFFGWDHMDRTLALQGLGLRRRLLFGVRHALGCSALGLWTYVPFAGTLFSFTMAAAGAMVVAKVENPKTLPLQPIAPRAL